MTVYKEFAPAKINLTLKVLGKRPDGYHELESLVAFADAGDYVTLDVSKPVGVTMSGPFAASIAGENLLSVTLRRLSEAESRLRLGAVHLEKNLPVAAGIGGGSADAAAVIRAVQRANPEFLSKVDWLSVARSIGADVPVCLESRAAWMTGIGEQVSALSGLPPLNAVLVNPLVPMPPDKTARVFRGLGAAPLAPLEPRSQPPGPFANAAELRAFVKERGNGLQASACQVAPVIADILRALGVTKGCEWAAVSGGGPTCFGVFSSAQRDAADELQRARPGWWVRAVELG